MNTRIALFLFISGVLSLILAAVFFWTPSSRPEIRTIVTFLFGCFLPGFTWSWVFWPKGQLTPLERVCVSALLSVCFFILLTLIVTRIGFDYAPETLLAVIATLIISGILTSKFRRVSAHTNSARH